MWIVEFSQISIFDSHFFFGWTQRKQKPDESMRNKQTQKKWENSHRREKSIISSFEKRDTRRANTDVSHSTVLSTHKHEPNKLIAAQTQKLMLFQNRFEITERKKALNLKFNRRFDVNRVNQIQQQQQHNKIEIKWKREKAKKSGEKRYLELVRKCFSAKWRMKFRLRIDSVFNTCRVGMVTASICAQHWNQTLEYFVHWSKCAQHKKTTKHDQKGTIALFDEFGFEQTTKMAINKKKKIERNRESDGNEILNHDSWALSLSLSRCAQLRNKVDKLESFPVSISNWIKMWREKSSNKSIFRLSKILRRTVATVAAFSCLAMSFKSSKSFDKCREKDEKLTQKNEAGEWKKKNKWQAKQQNGSVTINVIRSRYFISSFTIIASSLYDGSKKNTRKKI